MARVASLHLYPVKALAGISLGTAMVEPRGFQFDRRWMLVDPDGRFISQREAPVLCRFLPSMRGSALVVTAPDDASIVVPASPDGALAEVSVWRDACTAREVGGDVDDWFSRRLGRPVRMVYMSAADIRPANPEFSRPGDEVSFADGYPVHVLSAASLEDLNSRLSAPLPMNRFRPNIVVEGVEAYAEDSWPALRLGGATLRAAKQCGRCGVTTTDQATGEVGIEPLRTLATYRRRDGKVYFGAYFIPEACGKISLGDDLEF